MVKTRTMFKIVLFPYFHRKYEIKLVHDIINIHFRQTARSIYAGTIVVFHRKGII